MVLIICRKRRALQAGLGGVAQRPTPGKGPYLGLVQRAADNQPHPPLIADLTLHPTRRRGQGPCGEMPGGVVRSARRIASSFSIPSPASRTMQILPHRNDIYEYFS